MLKNLYMKELEEAYRAITKNNYSFNLENFKVVKLVHDYRFYWKPRNVKILLLAESHVFTRNEHSEIKYLDSLNKICSLRNHPDGFVRFVYCLGYGEKSLVDDEITETNPGTWQFWQLFNETCSNGYRVLVKTEPHPKTRIKQKIELLEEMKRRGIWLLDCSILGVYDQGNKPNHNAFEEILKLSFENYCQPIIQKEKPDKIIVIGKTVYDIIYNNFKGMIDSRWDWIHQPNAQVKSDIRKSLKSCMMNPICVQLNHPGNEKKFIIGNGYKPFNNQIIREWNNDKTHYRKFIRNSGEYILNLESQPQRNNLFFWGEWEGNSFFYPLNNGKNIPNGIHEPFHSLAIRGFQNTDPYVFGDCFKYATCSQTGVMQRLVAGSLILFGTTYDKGFMLDTVFVVKSWETAINVNTNNASNYTQVYREETLEQIGEKYLGPRPSLKSRLYLSRTWWDDNDEKSLFSYVPCKVDGDKGFHKVVIPIPPMAKQKVGHPFDHLDSPRRVWDYVTKMVLQQGFYLGLKFDEPSYFQGILAGDSEKESITVTNGGGVKKGKPGSRCY